MCSKNLKLINFPQFEFNAEIKGNFKENEYPVEKNLRLKVGAQIMLVKNDNSTPQRWVNGTIALISKLEKNKICSKYVLLEIGQNPRSFRASGAATVSQSDQP